MGLMYRLIAMFDASGFMLSLNRKVRKDGDSRHTRSSKESRRLVSAKQKGKKLLTCNEKVMLSEKDGFLHSCQR